MALFLGINLLSAYISPTYGAILAVISLLFPFSLGANLFFAIYWIIKRSNYALLSCIMLLLSYSSFQTIIQWGNEPIDQGIKVMTYNVRLFNLYHWKKNEDTDDRMYQFLKQSSPDVLALQEFYDDPEIQIKYPYHYKKMSPSSKGYQIGQIIYSKFPIIKTGSLDFENSTNNAIYADLLINQDTIRFYNLHLESLRIRPTKEYIEGQDSEKLLARMEYSFEKQAQQARLVLEHQKQTNHPSVILGDFNNTSFSYVYQILSDSKKDAFVEQGSGLARSFNHYLPLRIDFILSPHNATVNSYTQFELDYSDHFPIEAQISFP
ncbi:MAG: endonuclease/exonuclease/phosphatase family protein [Flavobacteriaceae bacterium]